MARLTVSSLHWRCKLFLVAASVLISCHTVAADPLYSSQILGLQQLQKALENPPVLNGWYSWTDFCNLPPTPNLKIVCQGSALTELRIVGDKPSPSAVQNYNNDTDNSRLSTGFSSSTLADALVLLPTLTVLELVALGMWGPLPPKLNNLVNLRVLNFSSNFYSGAVPPAVGDLTALQVVALDNNLLNGSFPQWMGALPKLTSLILSKNFFTGTLEGFNSSTFQSIQVLLLDSNLFNGSVPSELSTLQNVANLSLAQNQFAGEMPDLRGLQKLQTLNLNSNFLGPRFPSLGNQLLNLQMARNNLEGPIPNSLRVFSQLQLLDLSFNSLNGFPPLFLYTLPNITSLIFAENHFSGQFGPNVSLAPTLVQLDISSNYFTGKLPKSLKNSSGGNFDYQNNCFEITVPKQQPASYCMYESKLYSAKKKNVALIAGLVGGAAGVILSLLAALFVFFCRCQKKHRSRSAHVTDYATSSQAGSSVAIPSDLLSNARYLSQSMRLGVLTLPQNQVFSLEQLEDATDNFSGASLIGEGIRGKVYKGRLDDGTAVAVKCCCFDPKLDSNDIRAQLELLSKLRHHNVVSVIGYCLVEGETNSKHDRRLFVVSEYVDNGHLRSHISGGDERMNWLRRLAAVIGAAKGVHYLHHGVLPSIFHHDLKMTNILLDHNFVPKIADFGLPRPPSYVIASQANHVRRSHYRRRYADKMDLYNFGLILLEIVLGRPPIIEKAMGERPKVVELGRLMTELSPTMDLIDPVIVGDCGGESLATVVDIGIKCLAEDFGSRPSMEDVLWNLQYAVQVHDTSLADGSDEMFDNCSSPGSARTRKEQKKSGSFESSLLFEKQLSSGTGDHERRISFEDPRSPRYASDFLR